MPLSIGPMGLSTGSACAHLAHSLGIPSSWLRRPALTLGVLSTQPAFDPHHNHHGPRVLCSTRVIVSLASTLLQTVSLYPTTQSGLPMRPSLLWVTTPSLRAATHTPRGEMKKPQPSSVPSGLLHKFTESAPLSSVELSKLCWLWCVLFLIYYAL
jgi:hypothetical protein